MTNLPANKTVPLVDPEHRQKHPHHDEDIEQIGPKLFKIAVAKTILKARDEQHPLQFTVIEQLLPILKAKEYQKFIDILIDWFSGRTYGSWSDPIDLEDEDGHLSVVHAAVVNTGEVLMIEHACHSGISKTPLWNPETRSLNPSPTPPTEGLYCSGHCFLSNGELLVVGGRGDANHWPDDKDIAWLYDPSSKTWDVTRDKTAGGAPPPRTKMHFDRWYPTLVNVGDEPGRVLIASGDNTENRWKIPPPDLPPMQMEVYSEQSGKFQLVTTPEDKYHRPTYPGLHLLPAGEIFYAPVGFRSSGESTAAYPYNEDSAYFDFNGAFTGAWTDIGPNDRTKGMSVQLLSNTYPFVQVMTVGGGDFATTQTYQLIDLSTLNPGWDAPISLPTEMGGTDPVSLIHPNLVLLPDGTLFVCGGTPAGDSCWLFDPAGHTWSEMDAMTYERRYHSVAVLQTTAEVMATGGKHHQAGVDTVEVFKPPYLFRGTQPKISAFAPSPIHHGSQFTIETPQARDIAEVVLMRPMAVTHQTDSEQRRILLNFTCADGNTLTATAPNGRHPHAMAPRGYYMLFILNCDGVPSKAEFIHLH